MTSTLENFNNKATKLAKAILNMQRFYLKKLLTIRKKLYSKEKIAEKQNKPKKLWWNSINMPSKGVANLKYFLKGGAFSFNSKDNEKTFVGFSET